MKTTEFDNVACQIEGRNTRRQKLDFSLTYREVKHIRRCLRHYDYTHPDTVSNDGGLTNKIYTKFLKFGKLKWQRSGEDKRRKMKDKPQKCAWNGCEEIYNLTIDHINPLSNSLDNGRDNLRWLCRKHHLLREMLKVQKRKISEVKKVEERIKLIEEGKDPGILGYQVNKMTKKDEGNREQVQ